MNRSFDCASFADALPLVLDHAPDDRLRRLADEHAAGCDDCGALWADLTAISAAAGRLPVLAPSRDLWSGIEARIEAPVMDIRGAGGRSHPGGVRTIPLRIAGIAAAALIVVTAGVTYRVAREVVLPSTVTPVASPGLVVPVAGEPAAIAAREAPPTEPERPTVGRGDAPSTAPARVRSAVVLVANRPTSRDAVYEAEIKKLRGIVDAQRSRLDTATVRVIETNLRTIDSAIAQVRAALANDPASGYLIDALTNAYERKLELLRTAATLGGED